MKPDRVEILTTPFTLCEVGNTKMSSSKPSNQKQLIGEISNNIKQEGRCNDINKGILVLGFSLKKLINTHENVI